VTYVVDINDLLDDEGALPTENLRLRTNALRFVSFIEYGGKLKPFHGRETLVQCRRRPGRKQCLGMMWVVKLPDERIEAYCPDCREVEAVISDWQSTVWSEGIMPPVPMTKKKR
jgi:hypothetical protein